MALHFKLLILTGAIILWSRGLSADPIYVYTEENPPYNYMNADSQIVGLSTKIVRQVLDRSGLEYKIRLVPWVRAMRNAALKDNVLIYSITHTTERASKFDWLVQLAANDFFLFARGNDARAFSQADIQAGKYTAVCAMGSSECFHVKAFGFPDHKVHRIPFNTALDRYMMVAQRRVDMFVAEPVVHHYSLQLEKSRRYRDAFRQTLRVGDQTKMYLAAGKQVKPEIKEAITAALESLKAENVFSLISVEDLEQ